MSKIKLYVYPHASPHVHDSIAGFWNTVPFSAEGIATHCELTSPEQADYFYMGQIADKDAWLLHPNRFPYFECNEHRHIIDLEGDWRDQDHPDWLQNAIITTGHARLSSVAKFKRRFVRPVMSPLLMRLVKDPPDYVSPKARGFQFQGQRDSRGLREKVRVALDPLPGYFWFNSTWGVYLNEDDPLVMEYIALALGWSLALCPVGEGPTCRLYEMAFFGRPLVLIGDYQVFAPHKAMTVLIAQIPTELPVEEMTDRLLNVYYYVRDEPLAVLDYRDELLAYFKDPTAYLLRWQRGDDD